MPWSGTGLADRSLGWQYKAVEDATVVQYLHVHIHSYVYSYYRFLITSTPIAMPSVLQFKLNTGAEIPAIGRRIRSHLPLRS